MIIFTKILSKTQLYDKTLHKKNLSNISYILHINIGTTYNCMKVHASILFYFNTK